VLRRQVDATLRFMALSTIVGLVIIAILAVVLADIRGVLILVGLSTSLPRRLAYWYLRRTFNARLARASSSRRPRRRRRNRRLDLLAPGRPVERRFVPASAWGSGCSRGSAWYRGLI